jgi:hypothetical protein
MLFCPAYQTPIGPFLFRRLFIKSHTPSRLVRERPDNVCWITTTRPPAHRAYIFRYNLRRRDAPPMAAPLPQPSDEGRFIRSKSGSGAELVTLPRVRYTSRFTFDLGAHGLAEFDVAAVPAESGPLFLSAGWLVTPPLGASGYVHAARMRTTPALSSGRTMGAVAAARTPGDARVAGRAGPPPSGAAGPRPAPAGGSAPGRASCRPRAGRPAGSHRATTPPGRRAGGR